MARATEELHFQCFTVIRLKVNSSVASASMPDSAAPDRAAFHSLCDPHRPPPCPGLHAAEPALQSRELQEPLSAPTTPEQECRRPVKAV